VLALILSASARSAKAQFSSGSDGSDGALDLTGKTGVVNFNPTSFPGDQHNLGIFNFTTVTIPATVTLAIKAAENAGGSAAPILVNGPMYFLASGNVDIEGTIDLSGGGWIRLQRQPQQ
jgi:hypothetical protein